MKDLFQGIYNNKKVLITGHNGFKGSWLALWLSNIGAQITGISLDDYQNSEHFEQIKNDINISEKNHDIGDYEAMLKVISELKPDIIFHLAAQPLVRDSYDNPKYTFETNVMGTLNIFEAVRKSGISTKIVNVTTDKVYENNEQNIAFKESDPLGGHDPYSSSKACSEIISISYKKSYFDKGKVLLATGRAGNVIGGGDWSKDRLIPDIVRANMQNEKLRIRSPKSVRPWQHVLDSISGYLRVGQLLLQNDETAASQWNFGPANDSCVSVEDMLTLYKNFHSIDNVHFNNLNDSKHEARLLMLDCTKAYTELNWSPVWKLNKAVEKTSRWYSDYLDIKKVNTFKDLADYIEDAKSNQIVWTK